MTTKISAIAKPRILLTGTLITKAGKKVSLVSYDWSNIADKSVPASVHSYADYQTFLNSVTITMTTVYPSVTYSNIHASSSRIRGLLSTDQNHANILYNFSLKHPSPNDCNVYYEAFTLKKNSVKLTSHVTIADGTMFPITALVLYRGQIGEVNRVYIRLTN